MPWSSPIALSPLPATRAGIGGIIAAGVVAHADTGGLQLGVLPDDLGKAFLLIRRQCVHRIKMIALMPF